MKTSNLIFSSNIYVFRGANRIADSEFMSHVTDPSAIKELVDFKRRNGSSAELSDIQKKIYENALPCSYSNGDYTHGSIIENGKIVCVNKCENKTCELFDKCSKRADYRFIIRDEDATFDFVEPILKEESEIIIDIDLPDPEVTKSIVVKKLPSVVLRYADKKSEIEEIVKNYKKDEWGVRSHIRQLSDGTTTIVREHKRKHIVVANTSDFQAPIKSLKPMIKNKEFSNKLAELRSKKANEKPVLQGTTYQLKNIKPIKSSDDILNKSLYEKILVNAGPGTGKTHTVIEKLKRIAQECRHTSPEDVLVLCFSRSAVKVIRDRLNSAMEKHEIPYIAKKLNILTFDSFATWFLKQIEPEFDLSPYNYDARIQRFIEKYSQDPDILNIEYLIIDETQDLVGKRAEMVKVLLQHIKCGFLLLGDECQAIYDYQISNQEELNAAKLYEWLESYFKDDLYEYELTKEWRYQGELEDALKPLRNAMLHKSCAVQKYYLDSLCERYDVPEMNTEDIIFCCDIGKGKRAILSWSNGDAYRQSQELYARDDNHVKHTILTGSRKLLIRKELALILGEVQSATISRGTFLRIGKEKNIKEDVLNKIWNAILFTLELDETEEVSLLALKKALLSEKRVDEDLISEDEVDVVISTIHKSKGKEYDTVVVNKFGAVVNSEDIKVYYVGLTRSKGELIVKEKDKDFSRDIKTDTGRFIELNKENKIKRIELGIDGDVDIYGFVGTDVPGFEPQKRQNYIINKVKIGDQLKVSKQNGKYLIIHDGHVIGRMNQNALKSYRHFFPSGKSYVYDFSSYTDFADIFVKDIVTIVNQKLNDTIPDPYKKSGFWIGIEFCGYAKPMEE